MRRPPRRPNRRSRLCYCKLRGSAEWHGTPVLTVKVRGGHTVRIHFSGRHSGALHSARQASKKGGRLKRLLSSQIARQAPLGGARNVEEYEWLRRGVCEGVRTLSSSADLSLTAFGASRPFSAPERGGGSQRHGREC
eukprot:scaffold1467_cov264-Pinguiococcus_pyrenoidosus.AAC.10